MNIVTNIKIFDFNNPNFKILNTPEEIIEMLNETPVCINYECNKYGSTYTVLGIVLKEDIKLVDKCIYGNVRYFKPEQTKYCIFKNYEVKATKLIDGEGRIEEVCCIEMTDK